MRSLFTPEVVGSILSENIFNVTRTQSSTHVKRVSQHSAESCGVFSRRLGFLQQGKLTGWVRIVSNIIIVVKIEQLTLGT